MKRLFLVFALLLFAVSAFAKEVVYVYNWSEYIPESVLTDFEKETGIKVIYTTYDSNEVMYAKLKVLKGKGYDLVFPSTYFVNRMKNEGLLKEIDQKKLKNIKNLDPTLMNRPFDPGNKYSIPYLWGSTSLMINTKYVDPKSATSWKTFWKPEFKEKVLLNDDVREVFHIALNVLGFSGNSKNPKEIEAAYKLLKDLMPNVRVFNSDSPKVAFLNEEVVIGLSYNGEAFMAAEENPAISYVYPKEGAIFWVDNMCIPSGAENVDNAHKFIDFILRPEVGMVISEEMGYASPNKASIALLDEEVRNNPMIYPSADIVAKGEFQLDVGEAVSIYEKYWELLKTGK
jgi:spermidine/putrescine transport system substrate-binding protein